MQRTKPPFRADHVGSLLRSAALKDARIKYARGDISASDLQATEDVEIKKVIAQQEEIGLHSVTDGEYRRAWWHFDFLGHLEGVELIDVDQGIQFAGVQTKAQAPRVVGRVDFADHPMLSHFRYLKAHTKRTPKMTIPSPSMLHYRGGRKLINMGVYPKMEDFYHDLGMAYREVVTGFADAGCRYLQLDEVNLTYLCDPKRIQQVKDRGEDPAAFLTALRA